MSLVDSCRLNLRDMTPNRPTLRLLNRERSNTASYLDCVISIGQLHSETVNIWTHLIGAVWSSLNAFRQVVPTYRKLDRTNTIILAYDTAVATCFWGSTAYHVCASHSQAELWQAVDHIGILVLIWVSSISFTTMQFRRERNIQRAYIVTVSFAAVLSLHVLATLRLQRSCRRNRILTHAVFGGFAALPGLHSWFCCALSPQADLSKAFGVLVGLNAIGGAVYATGFLDRVFGVPLGLPDLSHHVMHITSMVGAWSFRMGLVRCC